jgi:hypothetical protein
VQVSSILLAQQAGADPASGLFAISHVLVVPGTTYTFKAYCMRKGRCQPDGGEPATKSIITSGRTTVLGQSHSA